MPVLDLGVLASLENNLPPSALRNLLLLFLSHVDNHLARINELLVCGDFSAAARDAHDMVSTAGNVGVARVSALARLLEGACRKDDAEAAHRLASELTAAGVAASEAIRARLGGDIGEHESEKRHA